MFVKVAKLTKLGRQQHNNLVVLTQIIFAVASKTQVEETKVDRINWIIRWVAIVDDWRNIPVVASVTNHVQDEANEEHTK